MFSPSNKQYQYWNDKTVLPWVNYDNQMNEKFENISRVLLENISLRKGEKVLDIGCGSGFTSYYCSKKVGNNGEVTAIDISKPLLKLFNTKYKKIKNITTLNKDVENYKFKNNSFDHIISRFGIMFCENPINAFSNIYYSLKEGGSFSFVCWTNWRRSQFHSIPVYSVKKAANYELPKINNDPGPFAFRRRARICDILKKSNFINFNISNIKTTMKAKNIFTDTDIMMKIGIGARMLKENNASNTIIKNVKKNIFYNLKNNIFRKSCSYKTNIFLVRAYKK